MTDLLQIGEVVQGPDFEKPAPLPELQDAVLDGAAVEALFADLAEHTTIGEIILKGGPTERGRVVQPSLAEAAAALASGTVRGVQIRYLHEGREWWDTLMRVGDGVRLVRIEH